LLGVCFSVEGPDRPELILNRFIMPRSAMAPPDEPERMRGVLTAVGLPSQFLQLGSVLPFAQTSQRRVGFQLLPART